VARNGPYRREEGLRELGVLVHEVLKRDPLSGHLFCFWGRRGIC
jgi:hypothetical protein